MKARTLLLALVFGALPVSSGALISNACAAEGARAALVVDTGGGAHRYCVSLPKSQVTGIELIKLANSQHGLQYKLGFGGNAVCQLAGVGPDGDDCFADDPYFWGYWRGDGSGGWTWSSSGAGSTVVKDGSVEGWSWGTGRDGNSHPKPPATTFNSVCPGGTTSSGGRSKAPPPSTSSGGGSRPAAESDGSASSGSGGSEEPKRDGTKKRKKMARRDRVSMDRRPAERAEGAISSGSEAEPRSVEQLSASAAETTEPGPPRAGLVGLGVAALLGSLATWRGRRRRTAR